MSGAAHADPAPAYRGSPSGAVETATERIAAVRDETPYCGRHEVVLGDTGWRLWRDVCLRSTGFPARRVLALCDDELAGAADAYGRSTDARLAYEAAYRAASAALPCLVADIAKDSLFREAVMWQNPEMVLSCLDRTTAEAPHNAEGRRREMAVASYLQRYCLKNDTIGFFGPVGWALLTTEDEDLTVIPGGGLLAERTTYFETWAIDQVGRAIAARGEVSRWLRPRRDPSVLLVGNRLHRRQRKPVVLSAEQLRMLMRCDGRRTVGELLARPEPDAPALLAGLRDLGALRIDLSVPLQAWPERWLRREIECIGDPVVRSAALRPLTEIVEARDAVATTAGDPNNLAQAMNALTQTFERVTGVPATRRAGQAYAGRTLVYLDTVRDVQVRLGQRVAGELAQPLGLVLNSARWLADKITEQYRSLFLQLFDRECQRTRADRVPLPQLLVAALPDLPPSRKIPTEIVARTLDDFQERWQSVLQIPHKRVARHSVRTAAIANRAAALFPARPIAWSCASQYSPDIMIAAASADALGHGKFLLVLGELHMAVNTLESRCFVEQHPDPTRLLTAATADHGGRRIVIIPDKDWDFVTSSRFNMPTALLSPDYTYWSAGNDAVIPPESSVVLPAAGLVVSRNNGDLMVRCAPSGGELPFFEVIGDIMTGVVTNAFRPIAQRPHQPRVTIDRLVLTREAWTFPISDAPWAFVKDEARRYMLARQWRIEHQLPERIFYTVQVEDKPIAADFRSLVLVNLLAKYVRKSKDAGITSFSITEMLPDLDQLWLADAAGERYTCELRFVATSA